MGEQFFRGSIRRDEAVREGGLQCSQNTKLSRPPQGAPELDGLQSCLHVPAGLASTQNGVAIGCGKARPRVGAQL